MTRRARATPWLRVWLLCLISVNADAACPRPGESLLAVIIDDLGYSLERGVAVAELPAPITLSIIPGTPHAATLAALGTSWGKELMVHMPMTSSHAPVADPMVLTEHLTDDSFNLLIDQALASVPGARGMNNHMGSGLTRNRQVMARFMSRLKHWQLFFVDSRTTADTVAADEAREAGIPHASRSVFLDHERGFEAVSQRMAVAVAKARENGSAIAIGHPHRETLKVLTNALPKLPDDVTLVPASRIANCDQHQRLTSIPREAM